MSYTETNELYPAGFAAEYATLIQGYQDLEDPVVEIVALPTARRVYDTFKWDYEGVPESPPDITRTYPPLHETAVRYDQIVATCYSPADGTLLQLRRSAQIGLPRAPRRDYLLASASIRSGQTVEWGINAITQIYSYPYPVTMYVLKRPQEQLSQVDWHNPLASIIERRQSMALALIDDESVVRPPQLVQKGAHWLFSDGDGPLRELVPFQELVVKVEALDAKEARRKELLAQLGQVPLSQDVAFHPASE